MISQYLPSDFLDKIGKFAKLIDVAAVIVIVFIGTFLLRIIIYRIINRFFDGDKGVFRSKTDDSRRKTLKAMIKNLTKYLLYFVAFILILGQFINITSLVTIAGVGGIVISLGLKSMIEDIVNGFFIIFEDQFNVGDLVTVNDHTGVVDAIGARTTTLSGFSGDVYSIHNGIITTVTNHSRKDQRVLFDVIIDYEQDLDTATEVVKEACEEARQTIPYFKDGPRLLGVQQIKSTGYTLRIYGTTEKSMQWDGERAVKKIMLKKLKEKGIRLEKTFSVLVDKQVDPNG